MGMAYGRPSLKTFYILQILNECSDEEHSLNATQIGEIFAPYYNDKSSAEVPDEIKKGRTANTVTL